MAQQQLGTGPDLQNRDPNELNGHLQVSFNEVFGEPDAVHSMDCVWQNSFMCFECGKKLCYTILTLFCGICLALEWGCEFAVVSFNHIWILTPCMRDFAIAAGCVQKCWGTIINCCLVPVCSGCGTFFSGIRIKKS